MPPVARIITVLVWLALPAVAAAQPATLPWPETRAESTGGPSLRGSSYVSDRSVHAAQWTERTPAPPLDVVRPASVDQPVAASVDPQTSASPAPVAEPKRLAPLPLPGARPAERSLPLSPQSRATTDAPAKPSAGALPSLVTLAGSLTIVLAMFFFVVWIMRRTAAPGTALLPTEVIEVLGRAPLSGRQQMHLLRCGRKLLLVSVTPEGAEPLTEITDPLEVDRLAGLCAAAQPSSASTAFRQIFHQFAGGETRDA